MATVINASVYRINKGGGTPDAPKVEQATPTITVSEGGLIVAESVQQGGVVAGGTKTARKQLDTAEGGNITPSEEEQTPAHAGEFLKGDLVVLPIPSEYIIPKGTKTITDNGEYNVRESEKVLVAVNNGVDAPDVPQAVPSITVSDNGLITATAVQEGGLVPSGTKTATKQLTTQEGKIITPTESEQTAVEDNRYTTGAVKVAPIPSQYVVPSGTKKINSNGSHDVSAYSKVDVNIVEQAGEYHLTVDFLDYEGYAMPMTGYYYVNGGAEHYFSTSQLDLWNVANADSQVRIAVINAGSPDVSGYNCSVSWTTDVVYIDDIEYYACIITISNFNGDAFVTYRET